MSDSNELSKVDQKLIEYAVARLVEMLIAWQKIIVESDDGVLGWVRSLLLTDFNNFREEAKSGIEGFIQDDDKYAKALHDANWRYGGLRFRK